MFYSDNLLNAQAPLGKLWAAAHGRKLKRNDVNGTPLAKYVEEILRNDVPLSLRLSGVLLLGAVNVYVIKLDMLQKDSHRALETLEQASLHQPAEAAPAPRKAAGRRKTAVNAEDVTMKDTATVLANFMEIHNDEGYLAMMDVDSNSLANAVTQHDQFTSLDVEALLTSQREAAETDDDMIGVNVDDLSEPEQLRDASGDLADVAVDAFDDAELLPKMATGAQAGPRRFSKAASATPSRDASGRLSSGNLDSAARTGGAAVVTAEGEPPELDADQFDMPELDAAPDFQAEEYDAASEGAAGTPVPAKSPANGAMDAVADAVGEVADVAPQDDDAHASPPRDDVLDAAVDLDAPAPDGTADAGSLAEPEQEAGSPLAKPSPAKKPARRPRARAQRKKPLAKLHASASKDAVKLPQAAVRHLIKDRSSLNAQLLSLHEIEARAEAVRRAATDLPTLLRSRVERPAGASTPYARLADAVAALQPVSLATFCGRADAAAAADVEDEILDSGAEDGAGMAAAQRTPRHGSAEAGMPAAEPSPSEPEILRDATPSVARDGGSLGSIAGSVSVGKSPGGALTPDAMPLPGSGDAPGDAAELDAIQDPEELPDVPFDEEFPAPDFEQDDFADAATRDDGGAGPSSLGVPARTLDPSDDNSLNPHTVATLRRLEALAQAGGKKRSRDGSAAVLLSQLCLERTREEAAKTFYDALVLQSKGFVLLEAQAQPFVDPHITLCASAAS